MRKLIAALVLAVPIAARAAPIGEAHLQRSLDECIQTCNEGHSFGFCAHTCGCMAGEMGRYWTQEEFDARASPLMTDPQAADVRDEMTSLAEYCGESIRVE